MSEKERQQLEDHLRRLEQQRQQTKRKLRALARQTQYEQRYRCGVLVELAGLVHLDPGTLLGGLCCLADRLIDADTAARWKTVGEVRFKPRQNILLQSIGGSLRLPLLQIGA